MRLSVIISTYNQPAWLEKVIWGYAAQTHRDFEMIIADDGSGEETRATIDRLRNETGLTIQHVWHADQGFRKCTILNCAALAANCKYIVFTDGDCIPRRDFLMQHAVNAKPGFMLSGSTVRLPMKLSRRINKADISAGRATDFRWLCAQGLPWSSRLLRRSARPRLARWLERLSVRSFHWTGCNASVWKADLLSVNGFDERMEYFWDDWEFGQRLRNRGVKGKRIHYQAICVHLDHVRGYAKPEAIARNEIIYRQTCEHHVVWTADGITKQAYPATIRAA